MPEDERRFSRFAAGGLAGLTLFRLAYLWWLPLQLVQDEPYYREWGRFPDWGYYSKPPGIGWINALAHLVGIPGEFGVRWPAVIFGSVGLWAMFVLVRRMRGAKAGLWAMLMMAACPGNMLLNTVLTIDAPLLCFWSVAMAALWIATRSGPGEKLSSAWWVVAGSVAAGMLAKQMMMLFPLLALIFVAATPARRAWLKRPVFWIAHLAPYLALVPPLLWNARHGWVTLHHTSEHVHPEYKGVLKSLGWFGEFVGAEIGVVGPLAFVFSVILAWKWLSRSEKLAEETRFGLIFSAPGLIVFLGLAFTQKIQPNWPAAFWIGGVVAVVTHLADTGRGVWIRRTVASGAALAAGAYLAPAIIAAAGLENSKYDPLRRLRGWKELAAEVQKLREKAPVDYIVFVGDRGVAAQLSFYLPDQPHVFLWEAPKTVASQYGIWGGPPPEMRDGRALVIGFAEKEIPEALRSDYREIVDEPTLLVPNAPANRSRFFALRATGLKHWPKPGE